MSLGLEPRNLAFVSFAIQLRQQEIDGANTIRFVGSNGEAPRNWQAILCAEIRRAARIARDKLLHQQRDAFQSFRHRRRRSTGLNDENMAADFLGAGIVLVQRRDRRNLPVVAHPTANFRTSNTVSAGIERRPGYKNNGLYLN